MSDPLKAYMDSAAKDMALLQGCNKDKMNCCIPIRRGKRNHKSSSTGGFFQAEFRDEKVLSVSFYRYVKEEIITVQFVLSRITHGRLFQASEVLK